MNSYLTFHSVFRRYPLNFMRKLALSSYIGDETELELFYRGYIDSIDWSLANSYWKTTIKQPIENMPKFLCGNHPNYTINNLHLLHQAWQQGEAQSKENRYHKRHTYSMRVGYNGQVYSGYQRQKTNHTVEIPTVEGHLFQLLKTPSFSAGRTDKGVHAISQIVSFATSYIHLSREQILEQIYQKNSNNDSLIIYDLQRVPKKFHARSSAQWRRYLYIVPLLQVDGSNVMKILEKARIKRLLQPLLHQELNYYTFSGKRDPRTGQGLQDRCQLYHIDVHMLTIPSSGDTSSNIANSDNNNAICIELVGNRFLRQMVRILVGTAIKEALSDSNNVEDDNCLLRILQSNDKTQAARPLPPDGLCFAGVGYDYEELRKYKFMPKSQQQNEQKDEL